MPTTLAEVIKKRAERAQALAEKYGPDYEETGRKCELNKAEEAVVREWSKSLEPEICRLTKDKFAYPRLTYCFAATGLGYVITVKEEITEKELNVTAALDWHFFG